MEAGQGDARHRRVRANAFVADAGQLIVHEHHEVEADGPEAGHRELYVVLRGRAEFTLDGERVDAPAGTLVYLADPVIWAMRSPRLMVKASDHNFYDEDLHFPPIIRIDRPRRIQAGQPVLYGQPRTRPDLAFVAGRDGHRETRGDQGALHRGQDDGVRIGGPQIDTGAKGRGVGRQFEAFAVGQDLDGDF